MLGYDSNFTLAKNFVLAIISKYDAITCCVVLLKRCEHPLLSSHMIGALTIKYPTCSTRGVALNKELSLVFWHPNLFGSFHFSYKIFGHPHKYYASCGVAQRTKQ
jgi:hypothetical protein